MTDIYYIGTAAVVAASWAFAHWNKPPAPPLGERVVIFGASSGIGKELALQYAARGSRVLLVARREGLLKSVVADCLSSPTCKTAGYVAADITIESDLARVAQTAKAVLGGCDTVVINAGIISVLTFDEVCALDGSPGADVAAGEKSRTENVVEGIFRTNVTAPILIAKHFTPSLTESKGKFVVVSSVAGTLGAPTRALYAATKHALNGFFNSLRIELGPKGVAVCMCLPGSVATDLRASSAKLAATPSSTSSNSSVNAAPASPPIKEGKKLTPADCARRIIEAGDRRARETYMPGKYKIAYLLHGLFPGFIDGLAAKKYGF
ncbi:hypothetical protein HDU86_004017 [Geranomyces michiganensis]|nr:hypothetical protein HDU86_004017 [Geranomyces michiganensis]